jgi:hypothetical protein
VTWIWQQTQPIFTLALSLSLNQSQNGNQTKLKDTNYIQKKFKLNVKCIILQKVCFGEKGVDDTTAMLVISTNLGNVEAMAFDWTSKNLYWIDSALRKIEVAREDGRYRKQLFNSSFMERPRALVLDPRFG